LLQRPPRRVESGKLADVHARKLGLTRPLSLTSEMIADGVAMDTKPRGELPDADPSPVGGYKLLDLDITEAALAQPW
jgi:hypothetical protein